MALDLPGPLPSLPSVPGVGAQSPGDIGAYSPNLPKQQKALTAKYAAIADQLSSVPEASRNALIDLDSQRVAQGQAPLSYKTPDAETWKVLQTTTTGKPATAPADRSIWNVPGNALHDLGDIVKSIPQLPGALLSIPSHPERALQMIPGAYIAQNIMQGHYRELATHPLNTVLDVLPYASKLAEGTKVAELAKATAAESKTADLLGSADGPRLAGTTRPLAANAFYKIADDGSLARSGLGEAVDFARNETKVGQVIDKSFGPRARRAMSMLYGGDRQLKGELAGTLATDEAGQIAREAGAFWDEHPDITPDRRAVIHQALTSGDPEVLRGITDPGELAAVQKFRDDLTPRMAAYQASQGDLHTFGGEHYNAEDYHALTSRLTDLSRQERLAMMKQAFLDPSSVDPNDLLSALDEVTNSKRYTPGVRDPKLVTQQAARGALGASERSAMTRSILHTFDAMGFDVTPLRELRRTGSDAEFSAAVTSLRDGTTTLASRPRMSPSDITAALGKYATTDPQVDRLLQALKQGPGPAVTKALDNLMSRVGPSRIPELDDPVMADSLRRLRDQSRYMNTRAFQGAGDAAVNRASKSLEDLRAKTPAARWVPLLNSITGDRFLERVMSRITPATPEAAAEIASAVMEKRWLSVPGYDPEELTNLYRTVQAEVVPMVDELKAQGFDPVFVHSVDPRGASSVRNPMVSEIPNTITSAKKRTLDSTGGVQDIAVGLHKQAVEYVSKRVSEDVIDHLRNRFGVAETELREALAPEVRQLMSRDPKLTFDDAVNLVASRTMKLFNPEELGYNWGGTRLAALTRDRVWIPNAVYDNLKRVHDPKSLLGGLVDPITNVFRISVTGLSPRLHLYNILGGATMLLGESGPAAFKHMGQVRDMLRDPEKLAAFAKTDPEMAAALGGSADFFKDTDFARPSSKGAMLALAGKPESALATQKWLLGKTLRRVFDEAQESRKLGTLKDAVGKVIDKSYELNGHFDDMYRASAYLQGKAKGIGAGLSEDAARAAGMEMARRGMMDYASLTATERGVIRSIFPFYSFTRHAMGYVLRYPFDHPLRAEMVAALGRAETEDAMDTLPSRLLGTVFLGSQDSRGHRTGLNLSPVNPFGDVANMLTLQGFLGGANPIVDTVLQSIGVDRGQAELYPTLRFDPTSGRMTAVHPNPLMALMGNTIPQTDILTALLGVNTNFNRQVRRDPQGAMRSMLSAGGLPVLWRQYNIPLEQMKAELARENSQSLALRDAQQQGDWGEAVRYPGLRGVFDKISQDRAANPQAYSDQQLTPELAGITAESVRRAVASSQSGRLPAGNVSRGI